MTARPRLVRLIAGLAIVALVLGGIALLSSDGPALDPEDEGIAAALKPADTSVNTPSPRGQRVGLRAGDLAPNFEFSDFEGRRLTLAEFRGRPVVLNFWASWCLPCRQEMPDLQEGLRRYEIRNLAVIGVNFGESYRTAAHYLDDLDVELTAFAFDPDQAIVRLYAIPGMPTTYFIDPEGTITRVVTGIVTPAILESAVNEAIIGWGRATLPP